MSDNDEEQSEVVGNTKLTNINVTAASPAVLERICNEICDEVMKQIPEDTIAQIAAQVMESRAILEVKSGYDRHSLKLSEYVSKQMNERVKKAVEKVLDHFMQQDETKKMIVEIAADAFTECMNNVPTFLAHKFFNSYSGYTPDFSTDVIQQVTTNKFELDALKDTLRNSTDLPIY